MQNPEDEGNEEAEDESEEECEEEERMVGYFVLKSDIAGQLLVQGNLLLQFCDLVEVFTKNFSKWKTVDGWSTGKLNPLWGFQYFYDKNLNRAIPDLNL